MTSLKPFFSRLCTLVLFAGACLAFSASRVRAQAVDSVYSGEDLETPPKFANKLRTARLVSDSYPANLKRVGVGGSVQVQFVVDANGKVEPSSVEVVVASSPQFGEAAKAVITQIEFVPGRSQGHAVRSLVLLPIVYR